jgi:hypothetical protein
MRYDRESDRQKTAAIYLPVYPALLLGVSDATRAEDYVGWIWNDQNLDEDVQ